MEKTIRFFLPISFILLITAYFRHPNHIGIDVSMYLQIGQFLIKGMKPYIDFVDINPPLIMYLNTIPVFLADLFSVSVIVCFKIILVSLIVLLTWCLSRILHALSLFSTNEKRMLVVIFVFLSAFLVYFRGQGQREHLFMLAFVPFLYLRLVRYELFRFDSLSVSISVGFLCGLFACFKPHFLLMVLVNDLALIWLYGFRRTFKKPEVFSFFAACIAYLLFLVALPSDVKSAFFLRFVPLIIKHYFSFSLSTETFFKEYWGLWVYGFISVMVLFLMSAELKKRKINQLMAINIISAMLIFFMQKKGWEYHLVPIIFIMGLAQVSLFPMRIKSLQNFLRLGLNIAFMGYIFYGSYVVSRIYINKDYLDTLANYGNYEIKNLVLKYSTEGDHVAIVSPSSMYTYPNFLRNNRYPASRYLFMFPMSFFNNPNDAGLDETKPYPYRSLKEMSRDEVEFISELVDDYSRTQPKLFVFVNYHHIWDFVPNNFDTFEYMKSNGLWSHFSDKYKLIEKEDNYIVYQRIGIN